MCSCSGRGGDRHLPLGALIARGDHEGIPQAIKWAGLPDREPALPAFLEGGGAMRHGRSGQ